MPWWMCALLVWVALALLLGVVLGRVIRTAERREPRLDLTREEPQDEEHPWAS